MARPVWFVNLIKHFFEDRFLFAKATHLPLLGTVFDRMLFEGDDILYLPKDHTISVNATIEAPQSTVLPSQVVAHFIEQNTQIAQRCCHRTVCPVGFIAAGL